MKFSLPQLMNRKPKFVEIPTVPPPPTREVCLTGINSESALLTDESEMNPPAHRQVKTTTHVHPMLTNPHPTIAAVQQAELKKKPTTSPASTLSDKGIGSSVGSFDSEFRHENSVSYSTRITYDPNKSGSLDSRTQEVNEKLIPVHTRSSSDIISHTMTSDSITQPMLAEQSNALLWNHDPRRLSSMDADSSSSSTPASSIRSRKSSSRKLNSRADSNSTERDVEVKKLPQLCRDSPGHSSSLHSQSSAPTDSIGGAPGIYASTSLSTSTSSWSDIPNGANQYTSPSPNDVAPPLPPKATHLRGHVIPPNHDYSQTNQVGRETPPYRNPYSNNPNPLPHYPHRNESPYDTEPAAANNALSSSDNGVRRGAANPRVVQEPMWSQDSRRNIPGLPQEGMTSLSSPAVGPVLGKAESLARLQYGNDKLSVSKFHASTTFLSEGERLKNIAISNVHHPRAASDEMFKRQTVGRSSTRSNPGDHWKPLYADGQARNVPVMPRQNDFPLQPLFFTLPQAVLNEAKFVGRDWIFNEITSILARKENKAAVIVGDNGHGKTSIIDHLVAYSYHGRYGTKKVDLGTMSRLNDSILRSTSPLNGNSKYPHPYPGSSNHSSRTGSPALSVRSGASSRAGSQVSLTEDACRKVASQVVAYHICQANNHTTCYLPEFLHSIAAQLSQTPQMTSYRELLLNDLQMRKQLSVENCIQYPSQALIKAIIEPLEMLRQTNKLPKSNIIILIDALNEAEQYRPDYGYSILSFLREHLPRFPDFMKFVITCRTGDKHLVENFPGQIISLDNDSSHVTRDVQAYVSHRIATSNVLSKLTLSGKADPAVFHKQLTQHLLKLSNGNFLYLRMVLDLIENGAITPKTSGFKVVPMNLHEVFLLQCNLRFHSYTSFDDVRDVISVALASLYPLNDDQLYQAVCSMKLPNDLPVSLFKQQMELLDGLLELNQTSGTRSFYHPIFREWLMGHVMPTQGTLQSSNRFKVDVKRGYTLLATVLSRQPPERLHKYATLELAHHVLKAGMFKAESKQAGLSASDLNAQFMNQHSRQLTAALMSPRHMFYPIMKVTKLLLKAGANPNTRTELCHCAPPLAVAAHTGCLQLAELLLMFEADVNFPARNGMSALTFAAAAGRLEMVQLLLQYGPTLSQVDQNGHTPLLHALSRNHSSVAKLLLSPSLYQSPEHHMVAAQQALVASATTDNTKFIEFLLESPHFKCDVNALEPSRGDTPLTSAAAHGRSGVCEFLVKQYRANLLLPNHSGYTPLLCAVKHDQWDAANTLLNCGADMESCDFKGKTPLIVAACFGRLSLLELFMTRGANTKAEDKEGRTALAWSALQGHANCVRSLIGRSDIHHCDVDGRTALDMAVCSGKPQIVDILLKADANLHHTDVTGWTALDRAIDFQYTDVVKLLLSHGARIQPNSWELAIGKPEVTEILLNHALNEGNFAYNQMEYQRALDVFATALRHIGELPLGGATHLQHDPHISEVCPKLLLWYSRCSKKLDLLKDAEATASRAIELKPQWHEAYYVRSRVLRAASRLKEAKRDIGDAKRHAPANDIKKINRLLEKIQEEIQSDSPRRRPSSVSSEVNIPQARPRLHSASRIQGNPNHRRSPSPAMAELSRSHQIQGQFAHRQPHPGSHHRMVRTNSQENLTGSNPSFSVYPNTVGPYQGNVPRRVPYTNPHLRPHMVELSRSLSSGPRLNPMHHHGNQYHLHPEQSYYPSRNVAMGPPGDTSRCPQVTDL